MRGLEDRARAHLDRRLSTSRARPIAVALSGGGDSLALLLMADAWAHDVGRDLLVLSVDHQLNPASSAWIAACAETARRLGRPFQALTWSGDKPVRGLPAAARAARHRLIADAARQAGAVVILLGHTGDDVLEARRMRDAGATTPEPRTWAPSPVWPEGRALFLLRPLLELRRAELRAWLAERGETWIEDPANSDPRYARARARPLAAEDPAHSVAEGQPLELAFEEQLGVLTVARTELGEGEGERFVGLACVCAGGGSRPPAASSLARLAESLRSDAPLTATLAGARIEADKAQVRIFREAGEVARGGLAPLNLQPGHVGVWDGRFELDVEAPCVVRPLAGIAARLPKAQQARLQTIPRRARGALPAIISEGGVSCPLLAADSPVRVRSLVGDRFRAAAGLIPREPDS